MNMIQTTVAGGFPCIAVVNYSPGTNFAIHSASLEPNDPEEFEIVRILTLKEEPAPWIERKITADDEDRIYQEFKRNLKNECHDPI